MPHGSWRLAKSLLGLFAWGVCSASCADMSLLQSGVCGNFVIDLGEDCDGHPLEKDTACVKAGEPNECRQVCNGSTRCPAGWGCGNDGVCRQASGTFVRLGDTIPFATHILMYPGDLDGDQATDLLLLGAENSIGTRPARIAYANPDAAEAEIQTLPTNIGLPAVGHVHADNGPGNVAFGTLDGVSLLQGTRNRSLEYSVFPFFTVPEGMPFRVLPIDASPGTAGDEFIALTQSAPGQTTINGLANNVLEPLFTLSSNLGILNTVGQGKFDESAPCEQLVFAERGANSVLVYLPCHLDGSTGWNKAPPTSISLPVGFTVDKGVLVADVDLNGHKDVLIETNGKAHVAWGLGDGTFMSLKSNGALNVAGPYSIPDGSQGEFPLAAADLNADQHIDFVLPHGLFVSKGEDYSFVFENFGEAWTTAVIADLNDNGLADAIAGSADAIDFTFLNNAGAGIFNPSTLPTEGPVSALAVGDFDGDLINDVAVVESYLLGSNDHRNNLAIGFGQSHGPPSNLVTIGRLESVSELVAAHVPDPGEDGTSSDNIADLIAVDRETEIVNGFEETHRHMLLFRGNGSRALHTSQPLTDAGTVDLPIATAIAKLGDDTPEIVALGANTASLLLRLWVVEGSESESVQMGEALSDTFHPYGGGPEISFRYGALLAAGNLDGDSHDELVVIAPYGNASDGAALVIADYDAVNDELVVLPEKPISARVTFDSALELHDIDGDGHVDAVLTTGTNEKPGDLIVFWGNEEGGLLTDIPEYVQPPGGATGFCCVPAKRGCTLMVASPSGTYAAIVNSARGFLLDRRHSLPYALSMATGDFDRDGLSDLALHTLDGLMFYRAVAVNP